MNPDFLRSSRISQGSRITTGFKHVLVYLKSTGGRIINSISPTFAVILTVVGGVSFVLLWLQMLRPSISESMTGRISHISSKGAGVARTAKCTVLNPCKFKIIADPDQRSIVADSNGTYYRTYLATGWLWIEGKTATIEWLTAADVITSKLNEGGRGMELSELARFDGKLFTFDDRTGVVFELIGTSAVPRHVVMEGDGDTTKGMKIEWATVKDDKLFIGSIGKEFTTSDGSSIVNRNPLWIATIDTAGIRRYSDWSYPYSQIRKALNAEFPGYVIHEAINWSHYKRRWVVLPRRTSKLPYDELADENRGANKMVVCNETFSSCTVSEVTTRNRRRGFSSFKFVPGTDDEVIIALKTEENSSTNFQQTYIIVFKWNGEILHEESVVPSEQKFEGIEFDDS